LLVHSSPVLKSWGFLYIFAVHIGELRFNPPFSRIWGVFYAIYPYYLPFITFIENTLLV